jgi:hypothetical protein
VEDNHLSLACLNPLPSGFARVLLPVHEEERALATVDFRFLISCSTIASRSLQFGNARRKRRMSDCGVRLERFQLKIESKILELKILACRHKMYLAELHKNLTKNLDLL